MRIILAIYSILCCGMMLLISCTNNADNVGVAQFLASGNYTAIALNPGSGTPEERCSTLITSGLTTPFTSNGQGYITINNHTESLQLTSNPCLSIESSDNDGYTVTERWNNCLLHNVNNSMNATETLVGSDSHGVVFSCSTSLLIIESH